MVKSLSITYPSAPEAANEGKEFHQAPTQFLWRSRNQRRIRRRRSEIRWAQGFIATELEEEDDQQQDLKKQHKTMDGEYKYNSHVQYNVVIYNYVCIYICIYSVIMIKIPLSRNGRSSRIKILLSRNFRELHVYLSRGPCWPTTPLMKIRSPPAKLRQRITDHFLVAF